MQEEVDNNLGQFVHLTLKMASAQVVKMSVTNNSPSQDSSHPDNHFQSRIVYFNTTLFFLFLASSCTVLTLFDSNCYCSHAKVNSMNIFPSLNRPATLQINHKILYRDTLLILKKAQFMKRTITWNMNCKILL